MNFDFSKQVAALELSDADLEGVRGGCDPNHHQHPHHHHHHHHHHDHHHHNHHHHDHCHKPPCGSPPATIA